MRDKEQAGLPEAVVYLLDSLGQTEVVSPVLSDGAGWARFTKVKPASYRVIARYLGFKEVTKQVSVGKNENKQLLIELTESTRDLSDVVVKGKTETQQLKEQAIKTAIISTRDVSSQPATLTELINRSAGIRIRQTGGLGSAPDLSVNGFQGRSVRYFKDGVPLDYLRDGYNIGNVPLNTLERVEVFKGVLPVSLGADALGGAVNLVPRKDLGSFLNMSYELGSFNTHRASVTGVWNAPTTKMYIGGDVFFNHSDNNYKAVVKVTDPDTRNQKDARLRMFHNAFTSYYVEGYIGWSGTKWADDFRLSLAGFQLTREQQHPALMTDPYGAVLGKQSSIIPTLRYRKSWLDEKLEVDQFLVYNTIKIERVDTLRGRYDWYGQFTPNSAQFGESRKPSLSDVDFTNFTSRTNLRYRLTPTLKVELNYVVTVAGRKGNDPYGPRFNGTAIDVLSVRTDYQKQVAGLGIENTFLDSRLTNVLMVKTYYYKSAGTDTWASRPVDQSERITKSDRYWGIAEALKFQLNERSFTRLSVEAANRLPQQDELFGDGIFVVPNFNLNAERSTNVNLGYRFQGERRFTFETNVFYRRTKGMILLIPIQPPYAQYTNMENVRGYGVEADASYRILSFLTATTNFTYQNLRLFGIQTQLDSWKNSTRLRNTPWFFANVGLNADFKNVYKERDQLKLYTYYNFMKEYYLETIPKSSESKQFFGLIGSADVASNLIIPTQHLLSAGANYGWESGRYELGFEVKNILNQDLYDYYRIQKAGRSFHVKLSISLRKRQ